METIISVKKHSGELVPFDPGSLKRSLSKSGASKEQAEAVYSAIQEHLYEGISTRELYETAFSLLKDHRNSYAARYSLKKALRDLGPAGYLFEKWLCKVFHSYGYTTAHSTTLTGKAVTHEIDVVAAKNDQLLLIECKFRNDVDARISVTTPMYFLSRFNDLKDGSFSLFGQSIRPTQGWLATNAYLTKDAIAFAEYYGVNLLSWNYPENNSIKSRVDDGALYPITCLTTISDEEKQLLLQKDCMLVKDILEQETYIDQLRISPKRKEEIIEEASDLIRNIKENSN